MDSLPTYLSVIIIVFLILLSLIINSSENAFSNCNIYHYKILAEEGNKKAKLIFKFANKFNDSLVTSLVGYNLMQAAISSLAAILFLRLSNYYEWADGVESIISTIVVTLVCYIVTDFIPKVISKTNPDKTAEFIVYPFLFFYIILFPLVLIFRGILFVVKKIFKSEGDLKITNEEFIEKAKQAEEEVLEQNEKQILSSALKFDNISVDKVLTPKEKIFSINLEDLTIKKLNQIILKTNFSRIPLYEENPDNIVGILNIKTYIMEYIKDKHLEIRSVLSDVIKVKCNEKVDDIFKELNNAKTHFALVYDEKENLVGMITMQDILEELVGDLNERKAITSGGVSDVK